MPYTPPSQLSPAASKQTTPKPSRSPSYIQYNTTPEFSFPPPDHRPQLPRSAGSSAYLTKHRRSPSTPTGNEVPEAMTDEQRGIGFDPYGSIRQSPPPTTNGLMPAGMTISPPESSHNSDDEEVRGRSRELHTESWAELESAVRGIHGQRKSGSPVPSSNKTRINGTIQSNDSVPPSEDQTRPPLSSSARKISHSRSNTDSNIQFDTSQQSPQSPRFEEPDTSDSEASLSRPPMVRKKSGELVKPALRPHSRRRPSSMPGTPTYSKAVHFDSQLEHVRHFLQVDRPLAVSASSSPAENYESETEFPFGSDETSTRARTTPSYEWEIKLTNFPPESDQRRWHPICVERVFLSADNKQLVGIVAVHNLAFQKSVVARFTLDYWKTTSEVTAEFSTDVRNPDGLDRFSFNITLADQANLENKTLFFCARYNVNGQEYWDSNNNMNYQVDFSRKQKVTKPAPAQSLGLGARPLSALPRSRPSPPVSNGRPRSMPSFDDFAAGGFDNFGALVQSSTVLIGEPKIKLRSPRSKQDLTVETPLRRNKSAAPMFGHRYDFNSSLTAARNNAYAVLGDQSGLTGIDTKQPVREVPVLAAASSTATAAPKVVKNPHLVVATTASAVSAPPVSFKPAALVSEKPPLTSQSYQELVDKYCFFGSSKATPSVHSTVSTVDGAADNESVSVASSESPRTSGSSTPRNEQSPSPPSDVESVKITFSRSSSPRSFAGSCNNSRSNSPALGSRYSSTTQTLLVESPKLTAIRG